MSTPTTRAEARIKIERLVERFASNLDATGRQIDRLVYEL